MKLTFLLPSSYADKVNPAGAPHSRVVVHQMQGIFLGLAADPKTGDVNLQVLCEQRLRGGGGHGAKRPGDVIEFTPIALVLGDDARVLHDPRERADEMIALDRRFLLDHPFWPYEDLLLPEARILAVTRAKGQDWPGRAAEMPEALASVSTEPLTPDVRVISARPRVRKTYFLAVGSHEEAVALNKRLDSLRRGGL